MSLRRAKPVLPSVFSRCKLARLRKGDDGAWLKQRLALSAEVALASLRLECADPVDTAELMALALDDVGHIEQTDVRHDLSVLLDHERGGAIVPPRAESRRDCTRRPDTGEAGLEQFENPIAQGGVVGIGASEASGRHDAQRISCACIQVSARVDVPFETLAPSVEPFRHVQGEKAIVYREGTLPQTVQRVEDTG